MATRKLPIGIQSFEDIRNNGYVYVDKTAFIWHLVDSGKVYFLSRPRRFGKSLLLSTMAAYFEGKKDLFKGLFIEAQENKKGRKAWTASPVIYFALSGGDYHSKSGLSQTLLNVLTESEIRYGLRHATEYDLPNRFRFDLEQLYRLTGKQVVVLVDEYDKPLLETMTVNEEQEEQNRRLYKGFFSVLKDMDQYLRFVFFTGVTKFSKVSVFSDLNQLEDISLTDDYAGICGITEQELISDFMPEICTLANEQEIPVNQCVSELAEMYDGYHFSKKGIGVYNPFSLLNAFKKRDFGQYWFETGTPTFLIQKLRNSSFTPEQFVDGVETTEMNLMDYSAENPDPIPLFYQAGYLTICRFDREFRIYSLKFPNNEVKYGFLNSLVPYVLGNRDAENAVSARNMILDLRRGNVDSFMRRLEALFAAIPYAEGKSPDYEREWRNQIFLILALLGQNVKCEVHSAHGRADCVTETQKYVYIFEFKLDKSADEALKQIAEKGYALPYQADERKVICVGVNFSTEKRNIAEWKCQ